VSGDGPKIFSPGELADEHLTPGQLRALARDTKDDLATIQGRIADIVGRLDKVLKLADRMAELEAKESALEYRVDELERAVFGTRTE